MNKMTMVGIIAAIVIGIGVVVGFSMNPENRENLDVPENEVISDKPSGSNLSIELNESISLKTNP